MGTRKYHNGDRLTQAAGPRIAARGDRCSLASPRLYPLPEGIRPWVSVLRPNLKPESDLRGTCPLASLALRSVNVYKTITMLSPHLFFPPILK